MGRKASLTCLTNRDILDAYNAGCLFRHPVFPFIRLMLTLLPFGLQDHRPFQYLEISTL